VLLLKLCWDGGKDEMTACIFKNVPNVSSCGGGDLRVFLTKELVIVSMRST
jgi:hypothetical protein